MTEYPVAKFMLCKIGTHAAQRVQVDTRKKKVVVGEQLRVKERDRPWTEVWVTSINEDGFFFADR